MYKLVVSLDGDRGNHDAQRVFADGSGTHGIVMKNLKKIQNRDPGYFNSRTFIDTQGRLHACERINNTFSIGDIENGFDFPRMKKIVNDCRYNPHTGEWND